MDLFFSSEMKAKMPLIAGGLSLALGQTFKIVVSTLKNPGTEYWERVFEIFDLLL